MSSTNRLELERLRFGASRGCWGDARARWRGNEAVTERRRIRWGQGLLYRQVSPRCAISTWEREGTWRRTVARGFFRRRSKVVKDVSSQKKMLRRAQGRCDGVCLLLRRARFPSGMDGGVKLLSAKCSQVRSIATIQYTTIRSGKDECA